MRMMYEEPWNTLIDFDQPKVPPPSPQDPSMLETVFSNHLSAKIHAVVNSSHDTDILHACTLERLLKKKRVYSKKPSRIPVLSSRIYKKKKSNQDTLTRALEKIHISPNDKSII